MTSVHRKSLHSPTLITPVQMREAILKSGYLLETRVEAVLAEVGYYVQPNAAFPDPDTGKSREIDISALSAVQIFREGRHFIFPTLFCECENNSQPVVFFTKESPISFLHHHDVKVSGIPVKFCHGDGYVSFSEFAKLEGFHHYCKGEVSTQYCSFQLKKDKTGWIALHPEDQHGTFNSLIRALEFEIGKHFDIYVLPNPEEPEDTNVQIYYPVVILQGELYSGSEHKGQLGIKKTDHVMFRKEYFLPNKREAEDYQIDVITEKYLPQYLKIIDSEADKIKTVLQRKKKEVRLAIDKIVEECRTKKR